MAELLILNFDTYSPDLLDNRPAFAWKKGHVIAIQEDGHKWGTLECPPKFVIVKVEGKAKQVQKYLEHKAEKGGMEDEVIGIRKYKLDIGAVPAGKKDDLENGIISLSESELTDCMKLV